MFFKNQRCSQPPWRSTSNKGLYTIMSTHTSKDTREKTPTEAAGYIAGTLAGAAQLVMPVRMWMLLIASTVLIVDVFQSDSSLHILRALCIFSAFVAILIGSAVFGGRSR
jgi:hypothetical protein